MTSNKQATKSSQIKLGKSTQSTNGSTIVAGLVAGCVTRTTTSPLDVVKILFQVQHGGGGSIRHTFTQLYQTHGVQGFWKGNLAGCCRLGPYTAIKFGVFNKLHSNPGSTAPGRAFNGAIAGLVATFTVYPMELVRTRLIATKTSTSIAKESYRILRTKGIGGLYRGCLVGLVGVIPFEGIQFASYEYGKTFATDHRWPASRWPADKTKLDTVDHLALGSVSGAVAQMVAYPFDTIKKRLQLQAANTTTKTGMLDCFYTIVYTEGVRGLYRGSVPNMARLVPYSAVMFASYEATKRCLQSL
ncbi:Aste57867_24225 [Aphanomyces stellatus]|uniref:Aste57867_24225 protein n=1 Tax=Aphanomyces stellatus TaxID=120398 RepID=A0A485LPS6_9STRA|nr:hypothetical protein As57867_024150 [Aphanomyces stellatus]VFU00866.1 Aste57867_24225 [Aphanomyces stellatus]